jgi:hypothetical protein
MLLKIDLQVTSYRKRLFCWNSVWLKQKFLFKLHYTNSWVLCIVWHLVSLNVFRLFFAAKWILKKHKAFFSSIWKSGIYKSLSEHDENESLQFHDNIQHIYLLLFNNGNFLTCLPKMCSTNVCIFFSIA